MSNSYIITIVKDIYPFSQSIARPPPQQKDIYNCICHNVNMINLTTENYCI